LSSKIEGTEKTILIGMLATLQRITRGVQASALITPEGLPIVSKFNGKYSTTSDVIMGAMSAALLSVGERAVNELKRGTLQHVLLAGEQGYLILTSIEEKAIFLALTTKKANLGFILLSMKKLGEEILEHI
jgi:predicted regulator of Ras-like GTPase activity (Roadblock/LC7/MglB family)